MNVTALLNLLCICTETGTRHFEFEIFISQTFCFELGWFNIYLNLAVL